MIDNPPDPPLAWRQSRPLAIRQFVRFRDTSVTAKKSGAHSRRISWLKRFLPLLAFIGLIVLIAWPMWKAPKIAGVLSGVNPGLVIENLHYTGLDSKAQPYSLSANRAIQVDSRKTLVDLERPEAEMTLSSGAWVSGRAQKGRYDQDLKKLSLTGHVELFHDAGHQVLTDELMVDLNTNEAMGTKPIKILGSFGQIDGQGFFLREKENVFIIQGPAKAVLKEKHLSLQDD